MSSKTFFGTPRKFCGMCGVVGIKDSLYYYSILFFICQQEKKECGLQGSGSPQKAFFFYYNIYFIICQVYMAGGRDESNIFLIKMMTMTVLYERIDGSRCTNTRQFANLFTNTRQFVTLANSPIYRFANFATIIYKSCKKYCNSPPQTPESPAGA